MLRVELSIPEAFSHATTLLIASLEGAKNLATCSPVQCFPKLGELGSEILCRASVAVFRLILGILRAISMRMVAVSGSLEPLASTDSEAAAEYTT